MKILTWLKGDRCDSNKRKVKRERRVRLKDTSRVTKRR